MTFEKFVAIDWSGAEDPLDKKKIQVAEYDPADCTVSLVPPPPDAPKGAWNRTDVFKYVRCMAGEKGVLIGFDFAFAYPYCDKSAYFPGASESPTDYQHLWEKAEAVCSPAENFYGGPFYKDPKAPFFEFYFYFDSSVTREGKKYENRLRATDKRAKDARLNPSSVFKCGGGSQVGPGSVAGMRFLLKVRRETEASIWPFDEARIPNGPTLVEIYPRLFLNRAAKGAGVRPTRNNIKKFLAHYGATLKGASAVSTDDERDAVISAAGMGWFAKKESTWAGPTDAAKYEGWIFGVK